MAQMIRKILSMVSTNRIGVILGLLFGTIGVWLLGGCALGSQVIEPIAHVFAAPARMIVPDRESITTSAVIGGLVFSGLFYGFIGILLEVTLRRIFKRRTIS